MNSFDEAHQYDRAFADHNVQARQPNMSFEAERLLKQAKTPFVTINPNDDPEVIQKLKESGTLRDAELPMQWYQRVGMGRVQLLQATPEEISRFVQQQEANAEEFGDTEMFKPRPMPRKFTI